MKVSLNWIKEYVDLPEDLSMEQLAHDLTMRTVEVEGYENPADSLRKVVIGDIMSVESHPDADKLRVCQVDVGKPEALQIVCGGSNLYVGEKVVVAVPGSRVRWHGEGEPVEIQVGKLRGVVSEGMICAAEELSLGELFPAKDDHEIMDLTNFPGVETGIELADLLGLDDVILEIDNKSMTNRPDLWGHYGLARELAAIYQRPLKHLPEFQKPIDLPAYQLSIENPEDCPRYIATVWDGLENGEAPFKMRLRLHLLDHTPRNLLVDLSNYVMLVTGEPNHAFDHKLAGDEILVRRASESEKLELLDETKLELKSEDMVIANPQEVMALAGIMGGKTHSIHEDTSKMVFETAVFNPQRVRKTSQRYDVRTDSETRFEKGIDHGRIDQALGLMQALLAEHQPQAKLVAQGEIVAKDQENVTLVLDINWLSRRLGRDIYPLEVEDLLKPLGFQTKTLDHNQVEVAVPSWRATGDITMAADLVEEVARMIGYENFEPIDPTIQLHEAVKAPALDLGRRVREFLAAQGGLQEIFTYPWQDDRFIELCGINERRLRLSAPPAPEQSYLRTSLIPGLLHAMKTNERYFEDFGLFESAQVYLKNMDREERNGPDRHLPDSPTHLGALLFGEDAWALYRRAKGILEAMPRFCGFEPFSFKLSENPASWADRSTFTEILDVNGERVGVLGLLSVAGKTELSVRRGNAAIFELNLSCIQPLPSRNNEFTVLPQFPQVEMDFSILCDDELSWQQIEEEIGKRVNHLELVDEYRGKQVPEGKKSLTFRVRYGKPDATLTAEEIEEKRNQLMNRLRKKLGAEIRA